MPSEIKRLLDQVEQGHLAKRRGYNGLIKMTREEYDAKDAELNECHARLLELLGDKATYFVEQVKDSANLLFEVEYYKWSEQQRVFIEQRTR